MPIFRWSPARGAVPAVGDGAYDALLARTPPAADTAAGLRPVAEVIAALAAAPAASELAAQADALEMFRGAAGAVVQAERAHRPRHPLRTSLAAKLAVAAAAVAVTFGGLAAAAYARVLPGPVQKFAHETIGAPPARPAVRPGHPAGPDAAGSAAAGPCTAYQHLIAHGHAQQKAMAFPNLAVPARPAANAAPHTHPAAPSTPAPGRGLPRSRGSRRGSARRLRDRRRGQAPLPLPPRNDVRGTGVPPSEIPSFPPSAPAGPLCPASAEGRLRAIACR